MKQKIVIKVSMPCQRSRTKAMTLAAGANGVISVAIAGEKLEVVGDDVDPVRLASCLRRKVGHADILHVEEVKDKKPPEDPKPPPPPAPPAPQPVVVHPPPPHWPHCYPGGYHHHHPPPPPVVVCDEPSGCHIM
uniref:ATFP4 n=1 Tax=Zea mays TaxID=4577 RepID=B6U0Q9_MAIZE|nr:ATFP4 [Zea mays]|eukprot:NP_001151460.1 uncharacterized protein LOC100285093 [Zea mays]